MNIEQRLGDALRARGGQVHPDERRAWGRVEARATSAQRQKRVRNAGLAVLAAAAVIVAAVMAPGLFDDDDVELGVTDGSTSTEPPTTSTTAAPTTTTSPLWPSDETWPGLWPFTDAASLSAHAADPDAVFEGPEETAVRFAAEYLGMPAPIAGTYHAGGPNDGEVEITPKPGSPFTTVVSLRSFTIDGREAWVVTSAQTSDIQLDTPEPLATIPGTDPVTVRGQARAFEGTVLVEVREDGMAAGEHLGQGYVTGSGSAELGRFQGEISFDRPDGSAGALVLYTASAEDGSVQQATVIRIVFS